MPSEIFVVTAPSGTGKTTLLKALLAADPRLQFSISYTTRPPRPEEIPGQDYFFVSLKEFERLRQEGALVEWVEQFGYAYGTSREWVLDTLKGGTDLVFDLDSRGARAFKKEFPQGTFIFVWPAGAACSRRSWPGALSRAGLSLKRCIGMTFWWSTTTWPRRLKS